MSSSARNSSSSGRTPRRQSEMLIPTTRSPSHASSSSSSLSKRNHSQRRSTMAPVHSSSSFMQSFREVLEDFEGEPDNKPSSGRRKRAADHSDQLGAQIAHILNKSPHFRMPLHLGLEEEEVEDENWEEDDYPSLQPVLSSRNWRWLKKQFQKGFVALVSLKLSDVPKTIPRLWKLLFWNKKSLLGGLSTFLGLGFLSLASVSVASTFASIWTLQFVWLVSMLVVALLVDLNELSQLVPKPVKAVIDRVIPRAIWFDDHILLAQRFRGREWNKQGFECGDSKGAPSFDAYLWNLPPPPSTNDGDKTVDEGRIACEEWGDDTTRHVEAIDFCHEMLREAFVRKQYSKLRKSVFKRKATHSAESQQDSVKDDEASPEAYDFAGSQSEPTRLDPDNGGDSLGIESSLNHHHETAEELSRKNARSLTLKDVDLSALDNILGDDVDSSVSTDGTSNDTLRSQNSSCESTTELAWIDVGAEIGMKLLGSAAVQKAMTSHDTAERITNIREKVEHKLAKNKAKDKMLVSEGVFRAQSSGVKEKIGTPALPPVHSMWTSAAAAAHNAAISPSNTIDSNCSGESMSRNVQIVEQIDMGDLKPRQKPFVLSRRSSRQSKRALSSSEGNPLDSELSLSKRGDASPLVNPGNYGASNADSIELVREKKHLSTPKPPRQPSRRRPLLLPGVKIAVPLFPYQPNSKPSKKFHKLQFQMATVVSSKRISVFKKNELPPPGRRGTNCLSITVQLDKSFLRDGKFAQMTSRVMDDWPDRYMPKHSKLPLGSCVATSFGLGVLVGWRVEDDCHVVRSLWQRRGSGSACAYLQRDAIHSTVDAAVGFEVDTTLGHGEVVGYTGAGPDFRRGRYLVAMTGEGKHQDQTLELNSNDIIACKSARFIPVVEHLKEAVQYQLQVDNYNDAIRDEDEPDPFEPIKGKNWRAVSKYSDILWKSFLRATEEDDEFDEGMNEFVASMVKFFDGLDGPSQLIDSKGNDATNIVITTTDSSQSTKHESTEPGVWFMNDMFGLFGGKAHGDAEEGLNVSIEVSVDADIHEKISQQNFNRIFSGIRTLMRTVSVARAGCVDEPEFKLVLSLCFEFLIFVKTIVKVQQKNLSPRSLQIWERALNEIVSTFGPVKERLEKIGQGIAERMEKQGRRAKVRLLRFVDTIVQDDILLMAMEHGDWNKCGKQLELALVKSKIIDEESLEHYHRTAQFVFNHFANITAKNSNAAARNNEKLAHFAMAVQCIAAPRKSLLRLLVEDSVLDTIERVLVRVFDKEEVASQMLSIHASNFHTLRQFRMLKDFTIAGKFWMPLLDAADAEFSYMVSKIPPGAQEYMLPISSLFSLCIVQFHKIDEGDLTKDWLDFLLQDEAVKIIQDIDMKLILALESFSRDVKEMMVILPYYPSIEDDILNLVDEVDIDEFLKEASDAVENPEKLSEFIREKSTIAIERFLDYLPKMSIPVEKRDLADGWVLTCRGADGGDLTLTDLSIKRENLTCQVLGGDTLFFPMLGTDEDECQSEISVSVPAVVEPEEPLDNEASVLDHIRVMLLNAQRYGCWEDGVGGVHQQPSDRYVASILQGLPVSSVLNCGIELWRNLEIDDDELLEIAIRDVSYQIKLQDERENADESEKECKEDQSSHNYRQPLLSRTSELSEPFVHRFNPRVDPSVLFLEMQKLTFHLDKFLFRIEKHESRRTVFDPVFDGSGSLMVRNVSIKLRVECVKEYVEQMGRRRAVPLLQIRELDVQLEKVTLKVKDTGADWLLNKVVKSFEDNITHILATNLNEQIREQMDMALENLNGYFAVNPELVLGLLDITMDDLEEKVTWV